MTTTHTGELSPAKTSFRDWRRGRPFWAGVLTLLAGLIVLFPPFASLKFGDIVVSLNTFTGISAMVIGVVLIACAFSFWSSPHFRVATGVVALLLSLVAVVTANLGSFMIGTMLGIVGAALGIAWSPKPKRKSQHHASSSDAQDEAGAAARPRSGARVRGGVE